jgi:outer membrane protein assembly factor BamB
MPRDETVLLFVGIKGSVVALDRATGNERWRTKLKGMSFVSLHRDDRYLYAATRGELFCLDPESGALVWQNALKGLGFGLVTMLSARTVAAALAAGEPSTGYVTVAQELQRRQAAQSGAAAAGA